MAHRVAEVRLPGAHRSRPGGTRALRLLFAVYLVTVLRITQWPELADEASLGALHAALAWLHARGLPGAVDVAAVEALANVVMFVPFGVLLPLAARRGPLLAVPAGAGFSVAIELSQLAFFPGRVATVQDVVMNTLGAAAGAALLHGLQGRRTAASRLRRVTTTPERRPSLLAPSTLEPVRLDLRRVFWVGTAVWCLALVVTVALAATGYVVGRGIAVCAVGVALGLVAVAWSKGRGAAHF